MKFFLKLKHWQFFGLTVGLLFIIKIVVLVVIATRNINLFDNPKADYFAALLFFVFFFIFVGWFYALGTNLNKKLPDGVKMSLKKFKWFSFLSVALVVAFVVFYVGLASLFWLPDIVFAGLYLFVVFCYCYCFNFSIKSLKAVELQRAVTFSDYAGDLFLFLFFPIGVWIIQPRINKIFEEKEEA